MRVIFINLVIILFWIGNGYGQINIADELNNKLQGKTKFQDIKSTVWTHFRDQLDRLDANDSIGHKKIMRQMKMWNRKFWINEYYTDENGLLIDANKLNLEGNAYKQREEARQAGLRAQTQNWINQGPTFSPEGQGRVDKLALHPTNPNIIFVGTPHGGLFKTVDGGNSWTPLGDYLPSLGVAGIAVNELNPNIIYVLSGEANQSCERCSFTGNAALDSLGFRTSKSQGVFKTTNGGLTWSKTSSFPNIGTFFPYELIIDPVNPDILLVATSKGIFRTQNGGTSWAKSDSGTTNWFWDIKFKPDNHNVMYAASTNTFWKSTDNGINWTNVPIDGLNNSSRISIAVTPANPSMVALLAGQALSDAGNLIGVFVSTDAGISFENRYSDNDNNLFNCYNILQDHTQSQINYNHTIAINPTFANKIVVGGLCVWSSDDGGYSWTQETSYSSSLPLTEYIHPDQHILIYHPNETLYCGNDGGIYKSIDNGDDWDFISNGLTNTQFYHFERENDEEDVTHEGSIWGGTQDNGIQEQEWPNDEYFLYAGGDGYDLMTDRATIVDNGDQDDTYYSVNEKVYADATIDVNITPLYNLNVKKEFFANLAMSPMDEDVIFAGYETYLYYSTDRGDNWQNINVRANHCVSTCQSNANVVYAAGTQQITKTLLNDFGNPMNLTDALDDAGWDVDLKIADIDVHTLDENNVIVGIAGSKKIAKVFKSINGGVTWENLTFNLPNVPVFSLKYDQNDGIYIGTSIGVFYKKDINNYWEPFSNGLPPVPVTEIELWPVVNPLNPPLHSPTNPEIWISTFGRGIWFTQQYDSGNCPATITLTGYATGNTYNVATNFITSNQIIDQPGANIIYNIDPNGQIKLTTGFRASTNNGSKFKALSSGCGYAVDLGETPTLKTLSELKNDQPKK
jgi:photosystem II stability/assembly factor-like uncharacterized protein